MRISKPLSVTSAPRLAKILDVSVRQLHYWTNTGILPRREESKCFTTKKGRIHYKFGLKEVFSLLVVLGLKQQGASTNSILKSKPRALNRISHLREKDLPDYVFLIGTEFLMVYGSIRKLHLTAGVVVVRKADAENVMKRANRNPWKIGLVSLGGNNER